MPDLLRLISGIPVISLVGNAKNAGKTTVLNALIKQMQGRDFAVSSIGLDGEELDHVSHLPKPRIDLPAGCLVATAEELLQTAECEYLILERTGAMTGLGEVLIVRVTKPGICLVGGPSGVQAMERVVERLRLLGAPQVFIDGAFARSSHAAAGDAFIYIVGAHQSPIMAKVVRSADYTLRRFLLPKVTDDLDFLSEANSPGYVDAVNQFHPTEAVSAVGRAESVLHAIPPDARYLFLPGAAGPELVKAYIQTRKEHHFGLILTSGLAIVADDQTLRHLFMLKRELRVLRPLRLCLIAANPFSPAGYRFDNVAFLSALKAISPVHVINVMEDAAFARHE